MLSKLGADSTEQGISDMGIIYSGRHGAAGAGSTCIIEMGDVIIISSTGAVALLDCMCCRGGESVVALYGQVGDSGAGSELIEMARLGQ